MATKRKPRNIYRKTATTWPFVPPQSPSAYVTQVNHRDTNQLEWNFQGALSSLGNGHQLRLCNYTAGNPPSQVFGDAGGSDAPLSVTVAPEAVQPNTTRIIATYARDPDATQDGWVYLNLSEAGLLFVQAQPQSRRGGPIDEP